MKPASDTHCTMRECMRALVLSLLFAVMPFQQAQAQPAGGYRQSCKDISVQGDLLRAACKDRNGDFHPAELRNFAQCVGDILNDNSTLRCSRGAAPPRGSYAASCEQVFVDGLNLRANCRGRDGRLRATMLANFGQCVGDVFNDNGNLGCGRGVRIPPGSYSQSCEQIFVDGNDLRAVCRTRRGNTVANRLSDYRQCAGEIQNIDGTLSCPRPQSIPAGDYQRSCSETVIVGSELHSNCRDRRGNPVRTALPGFAQCVGGIFNQDGEMHCSKGGLPPAGSYHQTCSMIWRDGETLHAECQNTNRIARPAQLGNISSCRSEISNSNGRLTCITGTAALPRGDFPSSCSDIDVSATAVVALCRTLDFVNRRTTLVDPGACRTIVENIDGFLTCAKGSGTIPAGSYHTTCHDVVVDGPHMTARCRRGDGSYAVSQIDTTGCPPGISNEQGVLKCVTATTPAPQPTSPLARKTICSGETVPSGWIIYDVGETAQCEGAKNATVFIIQYDGLPLRSTLTVCASSPTPVGWSSTGEFQDMFKCGWTQTQAANVKGIRRDR